MIILSFSLRRTSSGNIGNSRTHLTRTLPGALGRGFPAHRAQGTLAPPARTQTTRALALLSSSSFTQGDNDSDVPQNSRLRSFVKYSSGVCTWTHCKTIHLYFNSPTASLLAKQLTTTGGSDGCRSPVNWPGFCLSTAQHLWRTLCRRAKETLRQASFGPYLHDNT